MAIVTDDIEIEAADAELWEFVPEELRQLENPQTAIPQLAKDAGQMRVIEACVQRVPTRHVLRHGDARQMGGLAPESVHLVLTSPPYWTLKKYRDTD